MQHGETWSLMINISASQHENFDDDFKNMHDNLKSIA